MHNKILIKSIYETLVKEVISINLKNTIMRIEIMYICILLLWSGINFKHTYFGTPVLNFLYFFIFYGDIIINEADINDMPYDTSYADVIINYLIPVNFLHSLLLIYLFHAKSHLSLKFFIVSNITLVIKSYLFFGIPIDVFYIIPYLVFNFIYYNKRKKIFIHWIE